MRSRLLIIGITTTLVPLSFIDAPYPDQLVLQHVLTVLALVALLLVTIFGKPSGVSFWCLIAFLALHILGARWIYSFVPYDDWAEQLSGQTLSERFGWNRNHYDRFVHFASGLLGVPPASEALQRLGGMRPLGAAIMSISLVLSLGALYEILEWQIAMTFTPAQAEAYNGQQGDVWDPQKDLALACFGGIIAAGLVFRWQSQADSNESL